MDTERLHQMVEEITREIRDSKLEHQIHHAVQEHILAGKSYGSDVSRDISTALHTSGHDKQLHNKIFNSWKHKISHCGTVEAASEEREPLSCVRKAQRTWEKRIAKSLNTMCTELNLPLAKHRAEKDHQELNSHWTEIGTMEIDVSNIRPVYGPKDFLEVLVNLSAGMSNRNEEVSSYSWGLMTVPIYVQTLHELRVQYNDMSVSQPLNGVDDELEVPQELFAHERFKIGKRVVESGLSSIAQEYARKGCPVGLRGQIWQTILNIHISQIDRLYFEQLKQSVLKFELLIDLLYFKDIKLTSTNDDQYFVFEDYAFQVLLPFSRDVQLLEMTKHNNNAPAKSYIRGKLGMEDFAVVYPPNGIIPFYGFSMLLAPLCYVYDDVYTLYYVFRELYVKYFHHLHVISSDKRSILGLATLFESLLQTQEAQLFFHLRNNDIQPLRIVFKWLMRAFSGYLASREVLFLWDLMLAYDSLEVLPVLAVSVFSFRKLNLMQVKTQSQAESVLADLTTLKVVPLLQLSLFSK